MNRAKLLTNELGLQAEATPDPSIESVLEIADGLSLEFDDYGHDNCHLEYDDTEEDDFGFDD